MLIKGVSEAQIEAVANGLGIRAEVKPGRGRFLNVRLYPESGSDRFRRSSASYFNQGRRVNAVCYHGHWEFMNLLYLMNDDMQVRSAMASYHGREDFLRNAPEVGARNIGSQAFPIEHRDACFCTWQY
jgi:hypothetical protein